MDPRTVHLPHEQPGSSPPRVIQNLPDPIAALETNDQHFPVAGGGEPGRRFLRPFRQIIESLNNTLKTNSISNATADAPNQGS